MEERPIWNTKSCSDISKLENEKMKRKCSGCKKIVRNTRSCKKLPSNSWKALGVVTSVTLSLFIASLFCSSQTLFRAFELLADMHISRPSLWKATPQRLYWENRCSSFFLDVSMHLHFIKQSGYPKLFKLTRISKLPCSCNLFSERNIAGMGRFCNNCQELEQSKNGLF